MKRLMINLLLILYILLIGCNPSSKDKNIPICVEDAVFYIDRSNENDWMYLESSFSLQINDTSILSEFNNIDVDKFLLVSKENDTIKLHLNTSQKVVIDSNGFGTKRVYISKFIKNNEDENIFKKDIMSLLRNGKIYYNSQDINFEIPRCDLFEIKLE